MENLPLKSKDIVIDQDCPKILVEPIQMYWDLNSKFKFNNKPIQILQKFDLKYKDLQTMKKHSKLECEIYCHSCESPKTLRITTQTEFGELIRDYNRNHLIKCKECSAREEAEKLRELKATQKKEFEEFNPKHLQAIINRAWKNLNSYEFNVFKDALKCDDVLNLRKQHHSKFPRSSSEYKRLDAALRKIAKYNLLLLFYNDDKKTTIVEYYFSLGLGGVDFAYEPEEKQKKKVTSTGQSYSKDNSTNSPYIKLRLTKNSTNQHPDSPLYAGTVTFKNKIVIEPHLKYAFAQWERSNNELYFTLIPTVDLEHLPEQKRLEQEPQRLQKVITEFFNEIGNDLTKKP